MKEWIIDIGNTDLVLGYWLNKESDPQTYRLKTKLILDPIALFNFFDPISRILDSPPIESITISSVVPTVNEILVEYFKQNLGITALILNKKAYHLLPIHVLQPDQIGSDLVANALAAHVLYKKDTIIVDFGTAMSFTTIDASGKIIGVSIAPGIHTALKALTNNTAQLFDVKIEQPASALGLDTTHAIQVGITYGYDGLVRGIIAAQEKELGKPLFVVCTGGLSKVINTLEDRINEYRPFITLEGIQLAGNFMREHDK